MEISVIQGQIHQQQTCCIVLFINTEATGEAFDILDKLSSNALQYVISRGDLDNKPGKNCFISYTGIKKIERILLVATGNKPLTCEITHKVINGAVSALQKIAVSEAVFCMEGLKTSSDIITSSQYLAQQLISSSYCFTRFKKQDDAPKLNTVKFLYNGDTSIEQAVKTGLATGLGINTAKELGNLPGNICTPSFLASMAKELANDSKITTKIINEDMMNELGMHSFLSVSKGSSEEGRLIVMEYKGTDKNTAPYVLLGKGITFDSGGISLKPGAKMDEMKFDMCGAASVMGVMKAITELKPAINITGVIATAENMPSGNASKPGDIVTSMSGKTIEILNTDAEGRLVLCDALTYIEQFKPELVIDIATLTGACIVALGHHTSALFSNNDELAEALTIMGKKINDEVWRLPMGELYDKQLESNFADLANIGGPAAGSITAGCFLAKFAEKFSWAHLDIAGTAWTSGTHKGATGRPVPLLLNFLLSTIN